MDKLQHKLTLGADKYLVGQDKVKVGEVTLDLIDKDLAANSMNKEPAPLYKNLQANDTRFSEGEASYFYDILSPFIEKTFANEAYEDFKNFGGGKGEKAPRSQDSTEDNDVPESPYVELEDLKKGMTDNAWKLDEFKPEDYMTIYTLGYKRNKIYLREFIFMEIEFFSKRATCDEEGEKAICSANCFKNTRKKICELFKQADCQDSGEITSEQLYEGIRQLKTQEELAATPSMINHFFVHAMEVTTATMNIKEFTYAILCGYMERLFEPYGTGNFKELKILMDHRKTRAKLGKGPGK